MSFYTDCRLYLVSPPVLDPVAFAPTLATTLAAGDVAAFQLRLQDSDTATWTAAIQQLMPVCHARDVAFMVAEQVELAVAAGCDGAHLDHADAAAVRQARTLLGRNRQLGVSCGDSRDRAMDAAEAGADYVVFGTLHPFVSPRHAPATDPETLRAWTMFSVIPAVAGGGIDCENCLPLIRAGAHFLAVSDGIWAYKDGPAQAVRDFNRVIAHASASSE